MAPTALVTGASRGIGRALAGELAARGVRLLLTSRGGARLEAAGEACEAAVQAADLSVPGEVDALVDRTRDLFGGAPDLLIHNAGVFALSPAVETTPEVFERHLRVNLAAPFRLTRAFLPAMLERGSGVLVHMGSVAGREPFPGNAAYGASKYGLRGLHEVLSLELEGTGVRTLLVEAGPVDTGAWDALEGRLGHDLPAREEMLQPDEVARAVSERLGLGAPGLVEEEGTRDTAGAGDEGPGGLLRVTPA